MKYDKAFAISVLYKGQIVTAAAVENDADLITEYQINFPDGYKSTFTFYHDTDEKNNNWIEQGLGVTQLSKDVGVTLDEYVRLLNKRPLKILLRDDLKF